MEQKERVLGMTPPISTALPTEAEMKVNSELWEELRQQNSFESPAETQKREKVLSTLAQICDEFVRRVAAKKEVGNEQLIKEARGRIFTYGSYKLGVHGPGSDLDTLVVAPRYVTREDYFEIFPGLLQSMTPPGAITELAVVSDAYVPIIKFEFFGISIDLIFTKIAVLKQLPSDANWSLSDSNLLRGLDDAELRSLNGIRVNEEILNLVPEVSTFKLALRAIKLWAQRRAVYANIMGFPGGVAWALLVARVCQLYPKAAAATVVNKFFHIIRRWPWPQPVLLKPVESGPLQVRVWNPRVYKADTFHLMPIITPAYPSMCATYNITKSAMAVIQNELDRGAEISDKIMMGKAKWNDLFVKHTFFTSGYKYYLAVVSASTTKESHITWSGLVESKVRVLVQLLERHPSIAIAQAFNKGYERTHRCKSEKEVEEAREGSVAYMVKDDEASMTAADKREAGSTEAASSNGLGPIAANSDGSGENPAVRREMPDGTHATDGMNQDTNTRHQIKTDEAADPTVTYVYTTTHYIGLELNEGSKSLDLSYQVQEFKELCVAWDKYSAELNALSIQHTRNFNLPDDVFEPGEVKPKRPVKKSAVKDSAGKPAAKDEAARPAAGEEAGKPAAGDDATRKRPAPPQDAAPSKRHQPAVRTVG